VIANALGLNNLMLVALWVLNIYWLRPILRILVENFTHIRMGKKVKPKATEEPYSAAKERRKEKEAKAARKEKMLKRLS